MVGDFLKPQTLLSGAHVLPASGSEHGADPLGWAPEGPVGREGLGAQLSGWTDRRGSGQEAPQDWATQGSIKLGPTSSRESRRVPGFPGPTPCGRKAPDPGGGEGTGGGVLAQEGAVFKGDWGSAAHLEAVVGAGAGAVAHWQFLWGQRDPPTYRPGQAGLGRRPWFSVFLERGEGQWERETQSLEQAPRPASPWSRPGSAGQWAWGSHPGLGRTHEGHPSAGCVPPICPSEPTQNVSCGNKCALALFLSTPGFWCPTARSLPTWTRSFLCACWTGEGTGVLE